MLIFPLKKQWFEKIKSGEKTIEYRERKQYWTTRLDNAVEIHRNTGDKGICEIDSPVCEFENGIPCFLQLGYNSQSQLQAKITKIEIVNGIDTDLHIDKEVYAIHLKDIKAVENERGKRTCKQS